MTARSRFSALFGGALCVALSLAPLGARADGDETAMTNLVALVAQRLDLAVPVAQWKWANHRPITDAPRETVLLAEVDKRAQAADLDPAFAHRFFHDQIEASKQVQTALFEKWRQSSAPSGPAPDLATSTRPQLDRVTQALIAALARVAPARDAPDCPARLAHAVKNWKQLTRYGATDAAALSTALAHVCTAGGPSDIG
jgi:chorismate mutase